AKVDRQHDDVVVREIFANRDVVQPVTGSPRAAVHFEHCGKGAGTFWAVMAGGQRREAGGAQRFKVFRLEGRKGRLASGRCWPTSHIGGLAPSFSAVTRPAVRLPSGFLCATIKMAAPGFSRLASPDP